MAATLTGPTTVQLTWSLPEDDVASVVVRRAEGVTPPQAPDQGVDVPTRAGRATSVVDAAGWPAAQVSYSVFVVDAWGNPSAPSSTAIVTGQPLAAGAAHTCVVTHESTVKCWGSNEFGQLGDGSTTDRLRPTLVPGLTGIVSVAAGDQHSCAIGLGGAVWYWGRDTWGQLGDGAPTLSRQNAVRVKGITGAISIATGSRHTCAAFHDGSVRCWGAGGYGQLGVGSQTDSSLPLVVPGVADVVGLAAGGEQSCSLSVAGEVRCWGANFRLDWGNAANAELTPVAAPVPDGVSAIAAGSWHKCAAQVGGQVTCWGDNSSWELGYRGSSKTPPVPVLGVSSVRSLALGAYHSCGLLRDTSVVCWGGGAYGQIGDGQLKSHPDPTQVPAAKGAFALAAGATHTCALWRDGTAQCWGRNDHGQLGIGTADERQSIPLVATQAAGATTVSAGRNYTCYVDASQALWCWGANGAGELGVELPNGELTARAPVKVPGMRVLDVAAGDQRTCAVLIDRTVSCWGRLTPGEVEGFSTAGVPAPPSRVPDVTDAVDVSVDAGFACAVTSRGEVWCWGDTSYGLLGSTQTSPTVTPTPVGGLPPMAAVSTGTFSRACGIDRTARVWCWGEGNYGEPKQPVQVAGLTGVTQVSTGERFTCAVTDKGRVACWGFNDYEKLGKPASGPQDAPHVLADLTDGIHVAAGQNHACALLATGAVRCWGQGLWGTLGNGSTPLSSPAAVPVLGITSATALAAGQDHNCAIVSSELVCWGNNLNGLVGNPGWSPLPVLDLP